MAGILLDTNVLVYAHDPSEPAGQVRALEVLDRLHLTGTGQLSAQGLGEFFSIAVRTRRPLLSPAHAAAARRDTIRQPLADDFDVEAWAPLT